MYTTLISVAQLQALMLGSGGFDSKKLMIWDCSGDLMNPPAARTAYEQQHLAGASFIDLDHDLSDKSDAADKVSGGRHPLPSREKFAAWVGAAGITPEMQVIVYDRNGCNYCGRAWWMLKWIGHEKVAVLDGGLQAWMAAGEEQSKLVVAIETLEVCIADGAISVGKAFRCYLAAIAF